VSKARRLAYLILLAVALLVLAIIVLVTSRSVDTDLLAAIGILGGLAIVVVALPVTNGDDKPAR
jgi:peptidoglycan/LPS O-acetylase OafA/YrhL